jgi:branched-chain amino acid aminotransferase
MKKIDWDNLGFEINPADKMFIAEHNNRKWAEGRLVEYGTVQIYPSAVILNYGQGLFEGMKAYRTQDNQIAMFRPYDNAKRLNEGCRRLCMPELDEDFFVHSIEKLLHENADYIPPFGKGALYIRPILFGAGQMLGVNQANEYVFIIYMSPVGPYFKSGFSGIRLEIRDDYHRAPQFGTGGVKAVGNYATSLYPRNVVKNNGYDEVLYLDARTSTYVEEVGSANFFILKDGVVSTPRLSGSILPGITRDSVLTVAKERFNLIAQERDIRYDELFTAEELFCTGTAAVITSILSVFYCGENHVIGDGKPGTIAKNLYDELKGIQLGARPDNYGWFYRVK